MMTLLDTSAPYFLVIKERMKACTSWATLEGHTRPVPMDHTGSSVESAERRAKRRGRSHQNCCDGHAR